MRSTQGADEEEAEVAKQESAMKAAKPKTTPKTPAPKVLQTIDDPYFDDFEAFGVPPEALPRGGIGGVPGNFPGSGPPSKSSGSSNLGGATGASVAPGEEDTRARLRSKKIAQSKALMVIRSREAQNAARARQRRLNVLIGFGVFGAALIVLFSLGLVVFSGSRQRDTNDTALTMFSTEDANTTEDKDDIEMRRRLPPKLEISPEEYDSENYEVIAPNDSAGTVFRGHVGAGDFVHAPEYPVLITGGSGVTKAVASFQTKATPSATFTTGNGVREEAMGGSEEKRSTSSILEQSQNEPPYRLEELPQNTPRKVKDVLESAVSSGTCSELCQTQVSLLMNRLNPSYSPCENLYEHVCSNWQRRYSRLANERRSYSVDDDLLDKLHAKLRHYLLTSDGASLQESRQRFHECTNGKLVTEDSVEKLINYLKIDFAASSVEALAETLVRASRVGVTPFFDVAIEKKETGFSVTLIPSSFKPPKHQHQGHTAERFNRMQLESYEKTGTAEEPGTDVTGWKAFLQAVEHELCLVVTREQGSGANCFLTPESMITPSWDCEWYLTSALKTLASYTASTFEPFFVAPATAHTESNELFSRPRLGSVNYSIRVKACLRLLEKYDPGLVMDSVLAMSGGKQFVKRGKATLESLKIILDQRIHGAANISMNFASSPSLTRRSPLFNLSSGRKDGHWPANSTMLQRFLLTATWKRWMQGVPRPHEVFAATPTFEPATSTVDVPLPVFDLTSSIENPWLWNLSSMARVGPRFLKPILLSIPSKRLKESDLLRCLRNQTPENRDTESKTKPASLDAEEIASFAYSLDALHSHTAWEAAVPGHNISTDALFLFYYVFNKCSALPSTRDRNNELSSLPSRHEVDSVATAFGSSLLLDCTAQPEPEMRNCLIKSMK